jgi:hypothetical protein
MSDSTPTPSAGEGERVRFCLACGEILPYEQRRCPSCGHLEPGSRDGAPPARPCPACGDGVAAERLFCASCGIDVGGHGLFAGGQPAVPPEEPAPLLAPLSAVVALLAPVLVLIALTQLVLGALR